jgi:hypothetical protein
MTSPNGPLASDDEKVIALTPQQIGIVLAVIFVLLLLRKRCKARS